MKMKKLLQGSTFAAMAAAIIIAGTVNASAAASDEETAAGLAGVTVDTKTQTLSVEGDKDSKEILVGVATVKREVIKVASWDVYDSSNASVDLSKLSNAKDNYIAVMADNGKTPYIVKIPKAKVSLASFDAYNSCFNVATGEKKPAKADLKAYDATAASADDAIIYEYRTAYGSWTPVATVDKGSATLVDWSQYQRQGATLYLRTPGAESAAPTATSTKVTYGPEKEEIVVYESASLPGKEIKVSIPAQAKGPAVAVNYPAGKVTLPKNSEARLLAADGYVQNDSKETLIYSTSTAKDVATTDTIINKYFKQEDVSKNPVTEGVLEVRTVDTKNKKKAPSKWTRVAIEVSKAIGSDTKSYPYLTAGEADEDVGEAGVKAAVLMETAENTSSVIVVTYDNSKKTVKLENKGKKLYQITTTTNAATAPTDTAKAIALKAGKSVTLSRTNAAEGTAVWIRIAGDKASTTWVGKWTLMGPVNYKVEAKAEE